jgi:predicted MFS family arabinose efflux permease
VKDHSDATRMPLSPLIPLGLAAFAGFLNLFGMNPFFVGIAEDIGSSVSMVGYTSTVALLTTAIAGLIVGPISERVGIRRILVVGLVLAAGGAFATALAANFGSLVLARILAGIGGSVTGGVTVSAAALLYTGRQRQQALAIITAAAAMAVVIGIFLMTLMAEPYGWRGAYTILGVVLLLIGLFNRFMLDPDSQHASSPDGGIRELLSSYRPILGEPALRRLFTGATLHPAVLNGATAYLGAFLISQHGTSTQIVGLVFSLVGGTYFVGNLLAGNLANLRHHAVFSLGILLMGGFWAGGYLLPIPPLAIAVSFGLATFFAGIAWVTLLNTIANRTPSNVGTAMVLSASLLSFGGALGIGLSAILLDITGFTGLALGMGALALIGAVVGWVGPAVEEETSETSYLRESSEYARQE